MLQELQSLAFGGGKTKSKKKNKNNNNANNKENSNAVDEEWKQKDEQVG